jgi:hypothetical protein
MEPGQGCGEAGNRRAPDLTLGDWVGMARRAAAPTLCTVSEGSLRAPAISPKSGVRHCQKPSVAPIFPHRYASRKVSAEAPIFAASGDRPAREDHAFKTI